MKTQLFVQFEKDLIYGRDVAFMVCPGMGLSSLLQEISSHYPTVSIEISVIMRYWKEEYEQKANNKRFVIHAAIIDSLLHSRFPFHDDSKDPYLRRNLEKFLPLQQQAYDSINAPILLIIDDFSELPNHVAKIILDEFKRLRDSDHAKDSLKNFRFIVGGNFDFKEIYDSTSTISGVSPATNFHKFYPRDFRLHGDEIDKILQAEVPAFLSLPQSIRQLLIDWSKGYLYYVIEFAKWAIDERRSQPLTSQSAIQELQHCLEEHNQIALFSYCYDAWNKIKQESSLVDMLRVVVSAGHVKDSSNMSRKLLQLGLMINEPTQSTYYPANTFIELFLRQCLFEKGFTLPIKESTLWCVSGDNIEAYKLILGIENHLRTFIGDQLFIVFKDKWMESGLAHVVDSHKKPILLEAQSRQSQDQNSSFSEDPGDNILMYLEFSDLARIVEHNEKVFSVDFEQFVKQLPLFLDEINYYRRRVAHNRPMTVHHIQAIENRWTSIQKLMRRQLEHSTKA